MVPRVLLEKQKTNRKTICQNIFHHVNEDLDFLDIVVIGDERGCLNTTRGASGRVQNGIPFPPASAQQKQEWTNTNKSPCSFAFLIDMVSSTKSSHHSGKEAMQFFTWKS